MLEIGQIAEQIKIQAEEIGRQTTQKVNLVESKEAEYKTKPCYRYGNKFVT